VISHSPSKREKALAMGADRFVVSSDKEQMAAAARSIKFIIDTVSANHQVSTFLPLLEAGGTLNIVGIPGQKMQIGVWPGRRPLSKPHFWVVRSC
jgi:D-arabinose 1-dehydrogenase-like Zn-dependent alcohol dehydrogenase